MATTEKQVFPWWQKYTLTLNEASQYFGIGYKKLKQFVQKHADADFILWNGNRAQIKREQFERYLDDIFVTNKSLCVLTYIILCDIFITTSEKKVTYHKSIGGS